MSPSKTHLFLAVTAFFGAISGLATCSAYVAASAPFTTRNGGAFQTRVAAPLSSGPTPPPLGSRSFAASAPLSQAFARRRLPRFTHTNFEHRHSFRSRTSSGSSLSARTENDGDEFDGDELNDGVDTKLYTPFDRPVLAAVDAAALVCFAAIGKASHAPDGSLDAGAVLATALPFVAAWMTASPLTGVYSPDERLGNLVASTVTKTAKGWAVAVPLGLVLRGFVKGYVPPLPFIVVTLVATIGILVLSRVLFSVAEDFFVELVN